VLFPHLNLQIFFST